MAPNEHKPVSASLGSQVLLLTEQFGAFKSQFESFRVEIQRWMQERQSSWRGVWPVVVTVAGAIWFVLNLQISAGNRQVDDKANRALTIAEQAMTNNAKTNELIPVILQQNAGSKQDRDDQRIVQNRILDVQTKMLESLATEKAQREASDVEKETQIDALAQSANMALAELFRRANDAQNALHDMGAHMPSAAGGPYYFPNISNRNHRKQ